ncbi:MAG: hypoxanthine phosphoribosyltransferase [Oscillospiraceae bacterium]|nr:hypoxanthine phosphoribosyltransferase [Oscillospiraceae bacterium]
MKRVEEDIAYTLISQQEIYDKVHEIGRKIADDFDGKEPVFVGVLKGCFMFMADLIRCVNISSEIEFMAVSSYSGTNSTGAVRINKDLKGDINGRHIILVEDILDSGVTLNYLKNYLKVREPASISIATLLDKPARRKAPIYADYFCFNVPDEFVVGYGLDYNEKYRNLPYIGVLKPEIYS